MSYHEYTLPRDLQDKLNAYDQAEIDWRTDKISRADYDKTATDLDQAIDEWRADLCIGVDAPAVPGDIIDSGVDGLQLVTPWGPWTITDMAGLRLITGLSTMISGRLERGIWR